MWFIYGLATLLLVAAASDVASFESPLKAMKAAHGSLLGLALKPVEHNDTASSLLEAEFTFAGFGEDSITCGAGHYVKSSNPKVCGKCLAGTYSNSVDAAFCEDCPAGKFAAAKSSATCGKCPNGYAVSDKGAVMCDRCVAPMIGNGKGAKFCTEECPVPLIIVDSDPGKGTWTDVEGDVYKQVTSTQGDNAGFPNPNPHWDHMADIAPTLDTLRGKVYSIGKKWVRFSYTDFYGNVRRCRTTVKVVDAEPPTWKEETCPEGVSCKGASTCPSDMVAYTDLNECSTEVRWSVPVALDNDEENPPKVTGPDFGPPHRFPLGTHSLQYLADDGVNDATECNFKITVKDNVKPVISCNTPDSQIVFQHACDNLSPTRGVDFSCSVNDNCRRDDEEMQYTCEPESGSQFGVGKVEVVCSATDKTGNTQTDTVKFEVIDAMVPPDFEIGSCPEDMTVNLVAGQKKATIYYEEPTAMANRCGVTVTEVNGRAPGDKLPAGAYTFSYVAEDTFQNTAECEFQVKVVDVTAPEWKDCPLNMRTYTKARDSFAIVEMTLPTASDAYAVSYDYAGYASGMAFPVGITSLTFTATDANNQSSTCSFEVHVVDRTPPEFTQPSRVQCDDDAEVGTVKEGQQCGGSVMTVAHFDYATLRNEISGVSKISADCCSGKLQCRGRQVDDTQALYTSGEYSECMKCQWVASSTCAHDGKMDESLSLGCEDEIPETAAGYCDCGDSVKGFSSCDKKEFKTCAEVCLHPKGSYCHWRGEDGSLGGSEVIPEQETGYCECEDGQKIGPFTGRKPFDTCFEACSSATRQWSMWRAADASQCTPEARNEAGDKKGDEMLDEEAPGYCECGDGTKFGYSTCDRKPFRTCNLGCYKDRAEVCMFRATANCSPDGDRQPEKDVGCSDAVPGSQAGSCVCGDGSQKGQVDCGEKSYASCSDLCNEVTISPLKEEGALLITKQLHDAL